MCDDWFHNVEPFILWALANGWKKGLHVDRIDDNGSYSPENCRIATPKQNDRNKRHSQMLTYNGTTKHARDWADEIGMNYCTIRDRISRGWAAEDVINRPVDTRISNWRRTST